MKNKISILARFKQWILSIVTSRYPNGKPIKDTKPKVLNIFGLRFEIWKVIQGYRLSIDTETTRYIFKPFWLEATCNTKDLI